MMKLFWLLILASLFVACRNGGAAIDRESLVNRHAVHINGFDTLNSLTVGNGRFAFTVDATGLQSFPDLYKKGMPLGTQSEWGWHSYPNVAGYDHAESMVPYNFRGRDELYAAQPKEPERNRKSADYFRKNPHRLHLGYLGFRFFDNGKQPITQTCIDSVNQRLDLWNGIIYSDYRVQGQQVSVQTICHPSVDLIAAKVQTPLINQRRLDVTLRFPYPTGGHADDATNWDSINSHSTTVILEHANRAVIERVLDSTVYYVHLSWEGTAIFSQPDLHTVVLTPLADSIAVKCLFSTVKNDSTGAVAFADCLKGTVDYWTRFWKEGAAVDFSKCKDARAPELERRVVLSQYLTAIQCSGQVPPQETGLTYNSWFGRPHLEMHWWHAAQFALWNRPRLLQRSFDWYKNTAFPCAKVIAQRQGFDGVRWMKMTDPWANEAPSKVGSFLIWQQPHFIYMAELVYRSTGDKKLLEQYQDQVFESARFMASFATYDSINDRYILKGAIPAQETLRAGETVNAPFELSYWHFALKTAQLWRERLGLPREPKWDEIIAKLSPLARQDGLYLAAETALDTYTDKRFTSDHPAVTGAMGILPQSRLVDPATMQATLNWIWDNWNWNKTWGWDFPMVAMCAARVGDSRKAVEALLMTKRTNTYLKNGHNYQDARLRVYLPGNGGLLTAVAMMCAGWDGSARKNPGFPDDGNWDVEWEGLEPLP